MDVTPLSLGIELHNGKVILGVRRACTTLNNGGR